MEKRFEWQSENGIWKVTARVDDACAVTGEPKWFNDTNVSKLNKRNGRHEVQPSGKTYTKQVEVAREEARKFMRHEHKRFIAKHYDPYQALSFNDTIAIHTNKGNTGEVFFQEQTEDTVTVLNYVYDQLETIKKSDIEEMSLHYRLDNIRTTIGLI